MHKFKAICWICLGSFWGSLNDVFTKIFHVKDEIGAYIYFTKTTNRPCIQINKLNSNNNLDSVFGFDNLILNGNGVYTLNTGLFYSDAIKINEDVTIGVSVSNNITCNVLENRTFGSGLSNILHIENVEVISTDIDPIFFS